MSNDPGPWDMAMEAIEDRGCDCDGDPEDITDHTCIAGRCEHALLTERAARDEARRERDQALAEVERLTAERDSLRSQAGEASHVLAVALYGDEQAGEQPYLPSLARMMVDALTLEAANAEQARMQLDNGDDVDAATRRYLGEALGIADSDDTPPSLSDFYDAVVEARAERDAAAAKERAAVVAWLRERAKGRYEQSDVALYAGGNAGAAYAEGTEAAAADAIEAGDHLEATRA